MATPAEFAAMRRALELATLGPSRGANPRVGAVILAADGRTLGEGFHKGPGTAHAEVEALASASGFADRHDQIRGSTAVITLEPCNHTGKTPPCVRALLDAGIARVVFAQTDPNPRAAGGSRVLLEGGVDVESGILEPDALALNPFWTFGVTHGRPFVTWKVAASLDGRVAAADGSSRWITSAPARADVHALRAAVDAVMVGTGTVLADDPALTARRTGPDSPNEPLAYAEQPLRVIVGRRSIPRRARVLDSDAPTMVLAEHEPASVLAELHTREIRHVLLEGGPTLAGAFVRSLAVDEVIAYIAPVLLGAGPAALPDVGISSITNALRLETVDITRLGPDARITLRVPRAMAVPYAPGLHYLRHSHDEPDQEG
jgi:diaminohydroxyphosphoribosylaminopyrimidine deaminase / 5-amino-6-(5-phosphoribosylamino)uracil reductase